MADFMMPAHVLTGQNALEEAEKYLKSLGKRALIVTGPHVAKSPMMEKLTATLMKLNIAFYIYDGITGEPTDTMIAEGVHAFVRSYSHFVIGIGGGSPIDAAKAISLMVDNKTALAEYMGKDIIRSIPVIVAIPTTAGTGSEATKFTVITDSKNDVKMLLRGNCLVPRIAILQDGFTYDMPKGVTAATGLDALTHAIEAYTSKKATELTDVFAESAVRRIMKYLPIAYQDGRNSEARSQMALAALEAGVCINNSSVTIVHGMSRPIGALFHVPHGKSNAMLLADCLAFALDGALSKFARLGHVCGVAAERDSEDVAANKFLEAVKEVVQICEIPTPREYGIDPQAFVDVIPKMATDAMASGSPGNTRKNVTAEDCVRIYEQIIAR